MNIQILEPGSVNDKSITALAEQHIELYTENSGKTFWSLSGTVNFREEPF